MKKILVWITCFFAILLVPVVYAKDTVYSLNKYSEEELDYILKDPTGFVMAGTYEKEENNVQVLLLKYNENGNIEWKYSYGETRKDRLYGLSYLYNEKNDLSGYLLTIEETTNEERETNPHFLKIDLEGKRIEEEDSLLSTDTTITKVIETSSNEEKAYLVIGTENNKGFMAKYDKELNLLWHRVYDIENTSLIDVIEIENVAYYAILSTPVEDDETYHLIKFDLEGNELYKIKEDFEVNQKPQLEKSKDSYIIYGITSKVKLKKDETNSYYVMNYNIKDEEVWETIGNTPVDKDSILKIQYIDNEYYILSTNLSDKSIEVMRMTQEGFLEEKVKKLKNDYYEIYNFLYDQDGLFFVGQINCPEDDNCDYDANSLFLACTEDKVIEVEDNDSKYILMIAVAIIILMVGIYFIYKKRKMQEKKH